MGVSDKQFKEGLGKYIDLKNLNPTQRRKVAEAGKKIQGGGDFKSVFEELKNAKVFKGEHPGNVSVVERKFGHSLENRGVAAKAPEAR